MNIQRCHSFTISYIRGIARDTMDRLAKLSIHVQRMYVRCHVLPMSSDARFQLLSLQESSLMAIEALMSHCESDAPSDAKSCTEDSLWNLLVEFDNFHLNLCVQHIIDTAPPAFTTHGDWRGQVRPIPIGKSPLACKRIKALKQA